MHRALLLIAIAACGAPPSIPVAPAQPAPWPLEPPPEDLADWYARLSNDTILPYEWQDAAERIAHQPDVDSQRMAGESLRAKRSPSVTELLVRRIGATDMMYSCPMAMALVRWDRAAGIPLATRKLKEAIAADNDDCPCIARLTVALARAGQHAAIDDYATWIPTSKPSGGGAGDSTCFLPMTQLPALPALTRAANATFRDGSPWVPLVAPGGRGHMTSHFMLRRGSLDDEGRPFAALITVGAFNRHVVAALGDCREYGAYTLNLGDATIEQPDETSTVGYDDDGSLPPPGTHHAMRVCDYYASGLAGHDGAPAYQLYWPVAKRDAALPTMVAWVKQQQKTR